MAPKIGQVHGYGGSAMREISVPCVECIGTYFFKMQSFRSASA